jgi:hypothetical protein
MARFRLTLAPAPPARPLHRRGPNSASGGSRNRVTFFANPGLSDLCFIGWHLFGWVRQKYFRTGPSQEWVFSAPSRNRDGAWGYLQLFRAACRLAGMLKYGFKPPSSIQRTRPTSASVGWHGSGAGDNDGLSRKHSRPWNASTRTTQQPGREIGLQKGLSRMRGNSHGRFLEGLGARKGPWPTRRHLRIRLRRVLLWKDTSSSATQRPITRLLQQCVAFSKV